MSDNAIAVSGAGRAALGGLAQRLVQDGLLDESAMQDAVVRSKEKRVSLVSHLVAANLATARDIAISASNEFGVWNHDRVKPKFRLIVSDWEGLRSTRSKRFSSLPRSCMTVNSGPSRNRLLLRPLAAIKFPHELPP